MRTTATEIIRLKKLVKATKSFSMSLDIKSLYG